MNRFAHNGVTRDNRHFCSRHCAQRRPFLNLDLQTFPITFNGIYFRKKWKYLLSKVGLESDLYSEWHVQLWRGTTYADLIRCGRASCFAVHCMTYLLHHSASVLYSVLLVAFWTTCATRVVVLAVGHYLQQFMCCIIEYTLAGTWVSKGQWSVGHFGKMIRP